jgi:hypothetical protein
VLGALKALDAQNVAPDLPQLTRKMGQDLLNPPDVSGWKNGTYWLNASTLLERFNFADRLAGLGGSMRTSSTWLATSHLHSPLVCRWTSASSPQIGLLSDGDARPEAERALVDYLAADASTEDGHLPDDKVRSAVHLVMSLPTYQLG